MAKIIKKIEENYEDYDKTAEDYRNEFLIRRAAITKKTYNKSSLEIEDIYADEYFEQCALAAGGDVVAEDLLSYWFKHGNPALPENIDMSMKWQFLAGAGGNKHSISKLNLFFNYAYDSILNSDYSDDLIEIMQLDKGNYQGLLGEVICQKIVEDLNLNSLELAKQKPTLLEFNQLSMQRFTASLNRAMTKVDEYFRNFIQKNKKFS